MTLFAKYVPDKCKRSLFVPYGLARTMKQFGTTIYRRNLEMDAKEAYAAYGRRWMIAAVF